MVYKSTSNEEVKQELPEPVIRDHLGSISRLSLETIDLDKDDHNITEDISIVDAPFAILLYLFEFTMLILYYNCTEYSQNIDVVIGGDTSVQTFYGHYTDVAFMIFIGFGFLMTFMKQYSYSAVCYNLIISCVVYQWSILVIGFFHKLHDDHLDTKIELSIEMLIEGCFGAGTVMISFGALLGLIPPFQLLVMSLFEVVLYGLNLYIGSLVLEAVDMGGSMFVHTFGAYFGLSVSYFLNKQLSISKDTNEFTKSRVTSDLFAILGTIFLWVLWPSFNGAFATGASQYRVVINTALSLIASTIMTAILSPILNKKHRFEMEHIQNSILAGGVAVGSSSDLVIEPGGAILIGMIAGGVSVLGYTYLSPFMNRTIGLNDTCGVHNLHGLPGLIGALGGVISTRTASKNLYGQDFKDIFNGHNPEEQSVLQVEALFVTMGIALVGGFVVSLIMQLITKLTPRIYKRSVTHINPYQDHGYFNVNDDYKYL
jgi:ammonium transporter Rh